MRISTSQIFQGPLNSILQQQYQVGRTQQQLASGKRILTPGDDPAASASLLGIEQSLQITRQYQQNVSTSRTRLNQEESTLASVNNVLDRIREVAVQASNATLTGADRRSIASEVRQHLNELLGLANTVDPNGEYLFAGYQGFTQPFTPDATGGYTYNGDAGQRFVQVGPSLQLAVNDPGLDVFQAIRSGNGTFVANDNSANMGTGLIGPGSVLQPGVFDGDAYTIRFPVATAASPALAFDDFQGDDDDLTYNLSINGVSVYTVGESGAPISSLDELAGQINGASTATGVRAMVDGGALYLVRTAPSTDPITVTETLSGASDGDSDRMTGYFGSVLTGAADTGTVTYDAGNATRYVVENSSGAVVASGAYVDGGQITFSGVEVHITGTPKTGDNFSISPSTRQDLFTTVNNLISALESSGGVASAAYSNAVGRFLGDIDQAMENIRSTRAEVGGRLRTLDSQENTNEDSLLRLDESRSRLQDLDYASAITLFNQQLVGLEAAQKSFLQIQGLSLFKYL